MSLTRFREYTSEILLNTYLLLQRAFAEKGEQVIYSLLSQTIQSSAQTNAAGALEVCLFAARSIFDGFEDSEWNNSTLTFVKQNFQFIHLYQHTNFCITRASLLLISEMASILIELKDELNPILNFCLK